MFRLYIVRPGASIEACVGSVRTIEQASKWLQKPTGKGLLKPQKDDLLLAMYEDVVVGFAYVESPRKVRAYPKKNLRLVSEENPNLSWMRYEWQVAWNEPLAIVQLYNLAWRGRERVHRRFLYRFAYACVKEVKAFFDGVRNYTSEQDMKLTAILPDVVTYMEAMIGGTATPAMIDQFRKPFLRITDTNLATYSTLANLIERILGYEKNENDIDEIVDYAYYCINNVIEWEKANHRLRDAVHKELSTADFIELLAGETQ